MRAVNLIPSDQRAGSGSLTGRSGGAALILIGLVLGVAVLAVLYGTAARKIASEQGETARLEAQTSAVQARIGRLTPFTSFVSMAEQRTKTVAQLVQARFDWSHALHELGRVLPGGVSLSSFHGQVGGSAGAGGSPAASSTPAAAGAAGATPSSSTPPGSVPSMSLSGCAGSQSEVAETLQRLRLMDGAAEAQLLSSTKAGASGGSGSSGSSAAGAGACTGATFSVQVSFAPLPSTPVPTVAPAPTTPASTGSGAPSAAKGGATTQTVASRKGAGR